MVRKVLLQLLAIAIAAATYGGVACVTPSTNRTAGDVSNETEHRYASPETSSRNTQTQANPVHVDVTQVPATTPAPSK